MSKNIPFSTFNDAVQKQFALMIASGAPLVVLDTDQTVLWNTYLDAFPEGTNKIFRERREYDCNCCKNFVRRLGNVVALTPTGYMSIWDIEVEGYYNVVAKVMKDYLNTQSIRDIFFTSEPVAGSRPNMDNESSVNWSHFFTIVPKNFVKSKTEIGPLYSSFRSSFQLLERAMTEFKVDAIESVQELIASNSLYRGAESKVTIELMLELKNKFDKVSGCARQHFLYQTVNQYGDRVRFRSSAIGTLVVDLSEGMDLERAVASFESKVAPQNYKRTSAPVSQNMIKAAQQTIVDLGLEDSLYRRFAVPTDLSVDNVLYTAPVQKTLNVFDDLAVEAGSRVQDKSLNKVDEITLEKFLADVLPTATKIEALVEGRHIPNFTSLIAPVSTNPVNLFKWNNPFSWAYNGDITDAIKEKVKAAGGNVDGYLRISLAWFNSDDLDLSLIEPRGSKIYFGNRTSSQNGRLDIDANGGQVTSADAPVENIFYKKQSDVCDGEYKVIVDQFNKRRRENDGFTLQVEFNGEITNFTYDKAMTTRHKQMLLLVVKNGKLSFKISDYDLKESGSSSKQIWGVSTNTFVPVTTIMNSPNYWGEDAVGNKHTFFILENCKTDETARGFFNEFLRNDFTEHRKVFELLGSKTKATPTDTQVSGLGFSDTTRNDLVVRVTGKTIRTFKIKF